MKQASARRAPDATRQRLVGRAFEEIHRHGFRAASLDSILADAGVTKGALYHHFGTKAELGYAVVDEIVRPLVESGWRAVLEAPDPVDGAIRLIRERLRAGGDAALTLGCPFNNLVQEMSPVDEGFRQRLAAILEDWREATARALRRGQKAGTVRRDVDARVAAVFIIASVEGCVGMAKAARSRDFLEAGFDGLIHYLEQLRPTPRRASSTGHAP